MRAGKALLLPALLVAGCAFAQSTQHFIKSTQMPAFSGDVATSRGSTVTTIQAGAVTNAKMANMSASSVKANATGSPAAPTDVTISSYPSGGTVPYRDAYGNAAFNSLVQNFATTVTDGGTTTLSVSSAAIQEFMGSGTQNVVLPDATTLLQAGAAFAIINSGTGNLSLKDGASATLLTVYPSSTVTATGKSTGSASGSWSLNPASTYSDSARRSALPADGNTLSLYRFSGSGSGGETDLGSLGVNLSSGGSPAATYGPGGLNSTARTCTSSAGFYSGSIGSTAISNWINSAWTVEFWMRLYDTNGHASDSLILYVSGANTGNTDFPIAHLGLNTTNATLYCYQHVNFTTANQITTTGSIALTRHVWHHVALTRTAPSGGNVTFQYYVDGMPLTQSATTIAAPTSTPSAAEYVNIGGAGSPAGTAPANQMLKADVSELRWSNVAKTQAQVQASYLAGRP